MRIFVMLAATVLTFSAYADLTQKKVERWVDSLEPVQHWIEANEDKVDKKNLMKAGQGGMAGMFDNALAELDKAGVREDFEKVVKEQGYDSAESWAEDSGEITLAYLATSMEGKIPDRAAIEKQLTQVDASPLPAAQKNMMRNMLEGTLSMISEVEDVPAQDKALIQPYIKQIEERFGHAH